MAELMDDNPCYASSNPVYAEVTSAQRKAETLKRLQEFSITGPKKTNKKCCALTVIFLFLTLSLAGVAAIAALAYSEIANLQMQVRQLNESLSRAEPAQQTNQLDIQQLENQLHELQTTQQANFSSLVKLQNEFQVSFGEKLNETKVESQSQIADLQTGQLSSLQSSVNTLTTARVTTTTQLSSLQSSVNTLTTARDTTTTQLSSLQSSVDTLTTQVNSPYQNCIQETRSCTISRTSTTEYWDRCFTGDLQIDTTGYYTTDMRCEYEAPTTDAVQESYILRKRDNMVHCQCHLSQLFTTSADHQPLSAFDSTCTLVITRCPQ